MYLCVTVRFKSGFNKIFTVSKITFNFSFIWLRRISVRNQSCAKHFGVRDFLSECRTCAHFWLCPWL